MIGAEAFGQSPLPANGSLKLKLNILGQRHPIHNTVVDVRRNDAARRLVHREENPCVTKVADSQRDKLSSARLGNVSQEGPPKSDSDR